MTHFTFRTGLLFFVITAMPLASAAPCPVLSQEILSTKAQLRQMVQLKSELDDKYGQEIVEPKKPEKMIAGFDWDAAVKLAFNRRNLATNVSGKKLSLLSLLNEYCKTCKAEPEEGAARRDYCERCPDSPGC